MEYDFDKLTDRNGFGACKWDRRTEEEKAKGYVPLSIADMEFACAPCVTEMVRRTAAMGIYGYTDPEDRYYAAVRRWMRVRHGLDVAKDEISCLYGVVPALSTAIRAFTKEGEGVLLQTPGYYPFDDMIRSNNRVPVPCALLRDETGVYHMDFDALERAAKREDVRMLLLCSPHNPVGRVWTRQELLRLSAICRENDVLVVSDEIHFDLILQGVHTPYCELDDNCVVLTAPSKTFNVPGLQLSNAIIRNPSLKKRFDARIHADGYSNISCFGWAATVGAYEGGDGWLDALLEYLRGNFALLKSFFEENMPEIRLTPLEGTYLAWADFRALGLSVSELETLTRKKSGLFLDEGYLFGREGEGFERFNIALPRAELEKALGRLLKSVKEM